MGRRGGVRKERVTKDPIKKTNNCGLITDTPAQGRDTRGDGQSVVSFSPSSHGHVSASPLLPWGLSDDKVRDSGDVKC